MVGPFFVCSLQVEVFCYRKECLGSYECVDAIAFSVFDFSVYLLINCCDQFLVSVFSDFFAHGFSVSSMNR